MRRAVTDIPMFRRVSLEKPDHQRRQQIGQQEALVHLEHLVGQQGVVVSQLTPGGKARFGDQTISVLSDGDLIAKGCVVRVVEVRGSEVLVRAVEER